MNIYTPEIGLNISSLVNANVFRNLIQLNELYEACIRFVQICDPERRRYRKIKNDLMKCTDKEDLKLYINLKMA